MPRRAEPGESRFVIRLPTGRKAAGPGKGTTKDEQDAGRAAGRRTPVSRSMVVSSEP